MDLASLQELGVREEEGPSSGTLLSPTQRSVVLTHRATPSSHVWKFYTIYMTGFKINRILTTTLSIGIDLFLIFILMYKRNGNLTNICKYEGLGGRQLTINNDMIQLTMDVY